MDRYRHGLTNHQWKTMQLLLEAGGVRECKPVDNRKWLDALFWMSKASLSWCNLARGLRQVALSPQPLRQLDKEGR